MNRLLGIIFSILLSSASLYIQAQEKQAGWEKMIRETAGLEEQLKKIQKLPLQHFIEHEKFISNYLDSVTLLNENSLQIKGLVYSIRSNSWLAKREYEKYILSVDSHINQFDELPLIQAGLYQGISIAYFKLGAYLNGLGYYKVGQDVLKKAGAKTKFLYRRGGHYYYAAGFYEEALKDFKEGYHDYLKTGLNNEHFLGHLCNNIAVAALEVDELDTALFYFNEAYTYWKNPEDGNPIYLNGLLDGGKAEVLMKMGDFGGAIPLLENEIRTHINWDYAKLVDAWLDLGKCHLSLKNYGEAIRCSDTAEFYCKSKKLSLPAYSKLYRVKADIFQAKGNKGKVLEYLEKLSKTQELEKKQQTEVSKNQLSFIYKLHQKQEALDAQRLEIANAEKVNAENSRLQLISSSAITISLVLIILGTIIFFLQRKIRLQLREKKEQVEASLDMKEAMIKEIHHRIKNNLQVVNGILTLQSKGIEDKELQEVFEKGKDRIKSIAAVHELLYEKADDQLVNIQEYFEKIVSQNSLLLEVKHEFNIKVEQISLSIDYTMPLGIILNELITNTYKHAYPNGQKGQIDIELTQNKDVFNFRYSDHGTGLKDDTKKNKDGKKSLGLRLIDMMVKQLRGELLSDNSQTYSIQINFKG